MTTFADNDGTPQQTGHRSWFYFGVSGHSKVRRRLLHSSRYQSPTVHAAAYNVGPHICAYLQGDLAMITVANMNRQATLYASGYRVHHRSPAMPEFRQICTRVRYIKGEQSTLRFSHRFDSAGETFFAFCAPWSCADNERFLASLDARWGASAAPQAASTEGLDARVPGERVHGPPRVRASATGKEDDIYYRRQRLAVTLRGRHVELLTITDMHGARDGTEGARSSHAHRLQSCGALASSWPHTTAAQH